MENSGLLILAGAIVLLFLVMTRAGRLLVVIGIAAVACVTAYGIFVREVRCPRTDENCFVRIQRTMYGPCFVSDGAGLLRIEGSYFLTAQAGTDARATCFSLVGQ